MIVEMELTSTQTDLLQCLHSVLRRRGNQQIAYCTEWLGYLPYGLYHWVKVENEDISLRLPFDFGRTDFDALEAAGFLIKTSEWNNPEDEFETKVVYEVLKIEN